MKAATDMIRLWGGWLGHTHADDRINFNFEDERMSRMCWSGELAAVQVYGCRNGMSGLFAWWEE